MARIMKMRRHVAASIVLSGIPEVRFFLHIIFSCRAGSTFHDIHLILFHCATESSISLTFIMLTHFLLRNLSKSNGLQKHDAKK
jgi:hypothetical protein